MSNAELRSRARQQLEGNLFGSMWLMAGVACIIVGAINMIVGSVIPYVGAFILIGPLSVGLAGVFLKQARDRQPMNMGDLFISFNSDFLQYFLLGLMINIFVSLWSLLFLIPGIIKSYSYAMSYYIKADHPEYNWQMCIDESKRIMDGHKMDLFLLQLSFIGWILLSSLTCGIGMFWVAPYMNAAQAHFYESIK